MLNRLSPSVLLILGGICLTFTGCSIIQKDEPVIRDDRPVTTAVFNGWGVENCWLVQRQSEMLLATNGTVSDNSIRFEIRTKIPLMTPPVLSFNTMETAISPVGRGQSFAFELPYTSYDAANWTKENAYMILTYQPVSSHTLRQQFFPLTGLLPGLSYLVRHCE